MSVSSVSDLFRAQNRGRSASLKTESEFDFREGVLLINSQGVFVQRYFTIFESKIAYAYRGKERAHEFSPLTTIQEEKNSSLQKPVFVILTDGQKAFELGAQNLEDMNDWIRAVKDEVGKIIRSILEDFEKPGFGPFIELSQGNLIEEGIFASYVLRRQGAKVLPLFLVLKDGKLLVKRRATDTKDVGTWTINPKTKISLLDEYAGAAFALDKEILLANSVSTRSNWYIAFESAIVKSTGSKRTSTGVVKQVEIDFGAPAKTEEEVQEEALKLKKEKEEQDKAEVERQHQKIKEEKEKARKEREKGRFLDDLTEESLESPSLSQLSEESPELENESGFYSGTMMVKDEGESEANDFYKTFAGSVRNSGKVPWEDFSTFKEVDVTDDGQEKFANMKLEFEEVNPDEEADDPASDPAVLSINGDQTPDEKSSEFLQQQSPSPSQSHSPQSHSPQPQASNDNLLAVSRSNTRVRSPSNAKKSNMMRIRLKTKSPEGPIRIHKGCLESTEEYKSLFISSETKTEETLRVVLHMFEANSLKYLEGAYVLIEEEIGDIPEGQERYRRMLDPHESPLIAKLNWDNRNMHFAIAHKDEILEKLADGMNFKVKCMDGTVYSLKYNAKLAIGRVCEMLAEKFQLQKSNYSLFSLWMVSDKFEIQLEPFKQLGHMIEDWPNLFKTFTEHEEACDYTFVYRRWAFVSKSAERRLKDPPSVNLLFEQAQKSVMEEIYPALPDSEEDLLTLAAIKCQLMFGDHNPEIHTPSYITKNSENFTLLFPPAYFGMFFKKEECAQKLLKLHKGYVGFSKLILQMLYLQCVRQWRHYGSTFFKANMVLTNRSTKKLNPEDKNKGTPVRVGVNVEGIHIFDLKNNLVATEDLSNITICTDLRFPKSFIFEYKKTLLTKGTLDRKKDKTTLICLFSPQAPLIQSFVSSALCQQAEDAKAFRIMRNLQRKRSASDAQNSRKENVIKFSSQRHLSSKILKEEEEEEEEEGDGT